MLKSIAKSQQHLYNIRGIRILLRGFSPSFRPICTNCIQFETLEYMIAWPLSLLLLLTARTYACAHYPIIIILTRDKATINTYLLTYPLFVYPYTYLCRDFFGERINIETTFRERSAELYKIRDSTQFLGRTM